MEHVGGFTVAHAVSARDWQLKKNGGQWLLRKTFDTFCPLGPALKSPKMHYLVGTTIFLKTKTWIYIKVSPPPPPPPPK